MHKNHILTTMIDQLHERHVNYQDAALLNLVFALSPTQKLVDDTLAICNIDDLGSQKAMLLSYLMHDHPSLCFPTHVAPRLKGLIAYFRLANTKTLSHFSNIGKALNKASIPMILLKGAALKTLRPKLSRPMGDVDILVHSKDMQAAVQITKNLGYTAYKEPHSVDFRIGRESAVDIHHAIFTDNKSTELFYEGLFQRAKPAKAFGVHFLLPCHEDLFFLALVNLTKNLREHSSLGNIYYALCDCEFLLRDKPSFNWAIVEENSKRAHKEQQVRFAAEFVHRIMPHIIPNIDDHFPLTSKMDFFCHQIIFDEKYFKKLQNECQKILVLQLKKNPRYYGKKIIKLLLAKKLRKIPIFVRWFLHSRKDLKL